MGWTVTLFFIFIRYGNLPVMLVLLEWVRADVTVGVFGNNEWNTGESSDCFFNLRPDILVGRGGWRWGRGPSLKSCRGARVISSPPLPTNYQQSPTNYEQVQTKNRSRGALLTKNSSRGALLVCVCVWERERERDRDRETGRERESELCVCEWVYYRY